MGISNTIPPSRLIQPGVIDNTAGRPVSPFEGQCIFQKDTDQLLVWNGTAWVIPNQTTTNPEGLEIIKTQTIGSAVSSVVVSNAFSSTYDNYFITVNGGTYSAVRTDLRMQLGSSTTGYYSQIVYGSYAATVLAGATANNPSFYWVGSALTDSLSANITLMSPNLPDFTRYSAPWYADVDGGSVSGIHQVATSYTDFTLLVGSGTMTGGTIRVYGYRNS
jgi:hypothetical protein